MLRAAPRLPWWTLLLDVLCVAQGCAPEAPPHAPSVAKLGTSEMAEENSVQGKPTSQPSVDQPNAQLEKKAPVVSTGPEPVERHPIVGKWLLTRVHERLGGTSFVPVRYGGITFSHRGGASWSDGCNVNSGKYSVEGYEISVTRGGSSLRGCNFQPEDVHYDHVTHFSIKGNTLTLDTASQFYVLERYPYSPLSEHAWSLYEIVERATGKRHNVDRFRGQYQHLLLSFDNDQRFQFTDLNLDEFTGVLTVRGSAIEAMRYDAPSLARVTARPVKFARLKDSSRDYEETNEPYPTTLAQLIDWTKITSFRVFDGTIETSGQRQESELLELHSDSQIYVFTSR